MNRGRLTVFLMLILMLLVGSACAAQPANPEAAEEVALGAVNAVDQLLPNVQLPRVEIAYDANGVPSIFGIKTTTLQSLVGVNLWFLNLQPAWVNSFASRNLQHVEVEFHEDGLFLFANGKALPYLAWDEASLEMTGQVIDSLDVLQFDTVIRRALPLLGRLGVDVVIHFPRAEGVEAIAVRPREERVLVMAEATPEAAAVAELGVQYTSEGLPSVMGLTSQDLLPLGVDLRFMELPEYTMSRLEAADLQRVELVTQADGIYLAVNGQELPHLAYSAEHLNNAVDLYAQLYGDSLFTSFMRNLVPIVQATNVDLTVQVSGSVVAAD